jgi:ubiquinone/menaquinone biosynthesis C-methylase UbiE
MIDYNADAEKYAVNRKVNQGVLRGLLEGAEITEEQRVLEVGCGTGNYISAIQEIAGCDAWGIDPSEGMLSNAMARGVPVTFGPGSGESIPFEDESFDLVFSVDVIHHVQDRAAYYREGMRVLRPGGKICTVTDSEEIIRAREPLSNYFPETIAVELKRYPPVSRLRQLMTAAGFVEIDEQVVRLEREITNIQGYKDKSYSSLHLISEEAFQQGIRRLEEDLQNGPIHGVSLYVLIWGEK